MYFYANILSCRFFRNLLMWNVQQTLSGFQCQIMGEMQCQIVYVRVQTLNKYSNKEVRQMKTLSC